MVKITLKDVGKQYNSDWIFSNLSFSITPDSPTAILGSNGSGKSTLLQVILSSITPTLGEIIYEENGSIVNVENAYRLMSISAPYIELVEEFTLIEVIDFHRRLKPLYNNLTAMDVAGICQLEKNSEKLIRNFSSGMKQRVKLALAILSDTPVLLLDEPTSNLDQAGIDWYIKLISQYQNDRTIVVSSNSIELEYNFCNQIIDLLKYKSIPETDVSLLLF